MTISEFEVPVHLFPAYVILDLMHRHIMSKEEVSFGQLGGIKETDSILEVVRKYCFYKGVKYDYKIAFHMPSLEAADLYRMVFKSDTVRIVIDEKIEEDYEF